MPLRMRLRSESIDLKGSFKIQWPGDFPKKWLEVNVVFFRRSYWIPDVW